MRRLLPLFLVACARRGIPDVPITSAAFEDFHLSTVDVVLGTVQGDALLTFDGPDGAGAVPVHLGGMVFGLAFDLSIDPEGHRAPVPIDLSEVEDPTLRDVFGTYDGSTASASVIVGVSTRRLSNGRGAAFEEDHFQLGVGMQAAYQYVVVREGGNDGGIDTGGFTFFPTPTTTTTTTTFVGTGDTGAPADTGPATAFPPGDTGSDSSGGGCGCGGGSSGSSSTSSTFGSPSSTSTSGSSTSSGGTSTGGSTSSGSTSGSGSSGCAQVPGAAARLHVVLGALAVALLRRRGARISRRAG